MIEVEIRGSLDAASRQSLKEFLEREGTLVENHDRQMILLRGYPGYDDDPNKRELDIRLKDTDGVCEIVVKRTAHADNVGRSELSLELKDATLDSAKELAKAFGYSEGMWMHRKKAVYMHQGVEWSIAEAPPKEIYYFEAELQVATEDGVAAAKETLNRAAEARGLRVWTPEEYYDFVAMLGREVNKNITW